MTGGTGYLPDNIGSGAGHPCDTFARLLDDVTAAHLKRIGVEPEASAPVVQRITCTAMLVAIRGGDDGANDVDKA